MSDSDSRLAETGRGRKRVVRGRHAGLGMFQGNICLSGHAGGCGILAEAPGERWSGIVPTPEESGGNREGRRAGWEIVAPAGQKLQ